MTLPLSPDELLTTTRTVRRRLDLARPVPMEPVRECLEVALQAPSGSRPGSGARCSLPRGATALAARARGLGTAWTTLQLGREAEVAEILGIPDGVHQGAP